MARLYKIVLEAVDQVKTKVVKWTSFLSLFLLLRAIWRYFSFFLLGRKSFELFLKRVSIYLLLRTLGRNMNAKCEVEFIDESLVSSAFFSLSVFRRFPRNKFYGHSAVLYLSIFLGSPCISFALFMFDCVRL